MERVIESLRRDGGFMSHVSHWEIIPSRKGVFADIPEEIDPRIRGALESRGIDRLYSHQAECFRRVSRGENLTVVTPTASGKTLAYNLPVLQHLLSHREATAMYLFPTKALAQDQQSALNEIDLAGKLGVKIFTYDGDTPGSIRVSARTKGRIIITNPDMLHGGILPNHTKWIKFLQTLRFVVLDEIHTYRGIFGSHMTNLVRRLKRITAFYGSKPQFICCSATIGNPLDLARNIVEERMSLVEENGAPRGERHFILYNPPLVDRVQGIRRGVVLESQSIASRLLKAGVKTIVFARSRLRTELIASYIRDSLASFYSSDHRIRVASYRGGYLPNERRAIEKGLRNGEIHGVVSTSALELGIDIGGLDASVLAGFPGSIASTWQRAGRAGRSTDVSLSILIASASPMDQYIIKHPEFFFGSSPESARIDPDNIYILADQLKCAVFEIPFAEGERFQVEVTELLRYLEDNGVIRLTGGRWYWADRSYPAEKISLRTATTENVVIVDTTKGKNCVLGEMDRPSAKELIYENAIYLHRGEQYVVRSLDLEQRRCYVEETTVNYYTDSIVKTDIKLLHDDGRETAVGLTVVIGDILVRTQAARFKKLKFKTHENVGYGEIDLPEEEMHTRSLVLLFEDDTPAGRVFAELGEAEKAEVIRRLGYLVKHVACIHLLCDPGDLGIAERLRDPSFDHPCLYVYDNYPGGTGLSEGLLQKVAPVLSGCLEVVSGCPCREGCPACIGPLDEDSSSVFNAKDAVVRFLEDLISHG